MKIIKNKFFHLHFTPSYRSKRILRMTHLLPDDEIPDQIYQLMKISIF